ncbi:MAG: hypothetical protein QG603_636 [Patescibacteria group bacterium]|jgi:hypothetical protein|nr:hypothetical protein [Patescibacteria group bacterium]MDQ5970859.1 hypothetical protein [Patescibacteria group bacterium]
MNQKLAIIIIALAIAGHFLVMDYYNKSLDSVVSTIKPAITANQQYREMLLDDNTVNQAPR